jgi:Protein of unknown function (DUF3995)
MTTIAVIVFMSLTAIAIFHAAWGCGVRWPAQDERDLVALVVGATGRTRMPPPLECWAAAAAIFAAGLVALAVSNIVAVPAPPRLVTLAGLGVTAVFALRGIAAYLPVWRQRFSQEPFATMDRSWYGPLCLLFALAFAMLIVKRIAG